MVVIPHKSYPMVLPNIVGRLEAAGMEPAVAKAMEAILRDMMQKQTLDERQNYTAIEKACELVFSTFGTPPTTRSGPARCKGGGRLNLVTLCAGVAGTTASVLTVYKNGVALSPTLTLASGAIRAAMLLNDAVVTTDDISVSLTTIGAGISNVTVYVGY